MMSDSKSKDSKVKYKVIGLMSGTSLDGLDVAYCQFLKKDDQWIFSIERAQTIKYAPSWQKALANAHKLSAEKLLQLHAAYGKFLGEQVKAFKYTHKLRQIDFVASHGHTIFHQPINGFIFQLGEGHALHQASGLPVICDFRSMDVAHGGQGAPLVPIGDKFLFHQYDVCLNIGGIANLSTEIKGKRIAFDCCYANMGLNYLASLKGKTFDKDGQLAAAGHVNNKLLNALSKQYTSLRNTRPALSREGFEKMILPLLKNEKITVQDRLRTFTESVAIEIAAAIGKGKNQSVLLTGGGAYNSFLLYRLVELCGDDNNLVLPDDEVIKFKEALVFAFLGVLKSRNEINTLNSVTKANKNTSGGVMIGF